MWSGKKWHDRRKIITPAFHFKILDRFVNTFDRLGNKFIDKLHDLSSADNGDGIEFFNVIGLYTLDVISGKYAQQLVIRAKTFFVTKKIRFFLLQQKRQWESA